MKSVLLYSKGIHYTLSNSQISSERSSKPPKLPVYCTNRDDADICLNCTKEKCKGSRSCMEKRRIEAGRR